VQCDLLDRHGTNPLQELKLISFYKELIKKVKPDIVFTYTIKPNVYGGIVCSKLNIPYIANITGLGTAVENDGIMQKLTLFLYKKGLKKAQKVFFQNSSNRDFMLSKGVITGAYGMLPGSGVNLNQYHVMNYPERDLINFLFIARVMKEKGIDQYLDAAETIHKKYPQTIFNICGAYEPEYDRTRMEKLISDGIVVYHGLVNDIAEMHKTSACTIHPTYYPEGLSNVLLESCACGRPIITTDRPGCREVVDNGINGYIVNQKDSKDLIDKIEKFLSMSFEERKQMGLAGRAKAEREFDRQIVVEAYIREIETVNGGRRNG
jgi:galacturonosyltransferase